jgi:hypothetical protein
MAATRARDRKKYARMGAAALFRKLTKRQRALKARKAARARWTQAA